MQPFGNAERQEVRRALEPFDDLPPAAAAFPFLCDLGQTRLIEPPNGVAALGEAAVKMYSDPIYFVEAAKRRLPACCRYGVRRFFSNVSLTRRRNAVSAGRCTSDGDEMGLSSGSSGDGFESWA